MREHNEAFQCTNSQQETVFVFNTGISIVAEWTPLSHEITFNTLSILK